MRTDGQTIRGYDIPNVSQVWETVRESVRSTFTVEKKADVIVTAGTLALIGCCAFFFFQGLQNCMIAGSEESVYLGLNYVSAPYPFAH